jgi:hypothetical protein
VIVSPDRNHDVLREHVGCHFFNTTLRVYWSEFHDKESSIAGYRVAIGRMPRGSDITPYKGVGIDSHATFDLGEKHGLSLEEIIFAAVEATNGAGLSIHISSPPTRLISNTESNPYDTDQDFSCITV